MGVLKSLIPELNMLMSSLFTSIDEMMSRTETPTEEITLCHLSHQNIYSLKNLRHIVEYKTALHS